MKKLFTKGWLAMVLAAMLLAGCSGMSKPSASESAATSEQYSNSMSADNSAQISSSGKSASQGLSKSQSAPGYDNTEEYKSYEENSYQDPKNTPLSTFSIDVDTASYSNVRRFIMDEGQMPPQDAVRIEEFINYFNYNYPQPQDGQPFSINTEVSKCPWNSENYLALIGIQGKEVEKENITPSHLTFLIDTSGSMEEENKLPLLKSAIRLLVNQLRPEDSISLVTYSGSAGIKLEYASGTEKEKILKVVNKLSAGGSTAGSAGLKLAYQIARKYFVIEGNNRVILATDGDFNVGPSSDEELTRMIEEKRKGGIFLSILGFGTGNYKDSKMESIADKGNGNYSYIDSLKEAQKVLVSEMSGTILTIAKDVKIQVEFNPARVSEYRLIGYENRALNAEDFNNDRVDAGELGAGHTVTALYELVPAAVKTGALVDDLKYQDVDVNKSSDWMTVKLRYKEPEGNTSKLIEHVVTGDQFTSRLDSNLMFAAAAAEFGMLLIKSPYLENATYEQAISLASASQGYDPGGYRKEFIQIVRKARDMNGRE